MKTRLNLTRLNRLPLLLMALLATASLGAAAMIDLHDHAEELAGGFSETLRDLPPTLLLNLGNARLLARGGIDD